MRKRKDGRHRQAYLPVIQQRETTMRIFDRLRVKFGKPTPEHQTDSKATRSDEDVPYSAVEIESMCCGHCSGNPEAHRAELPTAR